MDPAGTASCVQGRLSPRHGLQGQYTSHSIHEEGTAVRPESEHSDHSYCEEQASDIKRNNKLTHGWRRVVRNFTPSYADISSFVSNLLTRLML